ncbi:heme/hemin ABC transporter substrate-binding protein [Janibacter cremeus]|uniref:Iron complex transport system substrate-binding protein n=1 Tax=Janibacter cremeus TaxID=1285192 RepID=A0A852VJP8_9MICO|nr:ABC transporter substrate-binding protein [Janibacter cremeus]NYF97292.1 iron complex transport system substrate-binding protein [Janibacter cremeus]
MTGSAQVRCRLLMLLTASLVALAGCGTSTGQPVGDDGASAVTTTPLSQVTPIDSPRTHQGPSTALLTDEHVDPITTDTTPQLPASVTSHDRGGDRPVDVTDASRVIAMDLSGALAATVHGLGLGKTLVGRDQSTTFPGAEDLPVVTSGGHSINAEAVLALEPSLVITDGSIGPRDVVEQLQDVGVTVVFVENDASFAGAARLAEDVGAIYGVPGVGAQLAQRITDEVEQTTQQIERLAPHARKEKARMIFLYIRGNSGVYYLFGDESGADDLIEGLGGIDVASEQGWPGQRPMTDEAITSANPDLILVMTDGLTSAGGIDHLLQDKPALALTNAGQNRRFVDMADGDILSFGPRSARILAALARAVYAPEGGAS